MNVDDYLLRIRYHGSRAPTAQTLKHLQVAHLLTVPFENLSIHAGEPIVLDDDALFDKIVRRGLGGFCYELNGLFAALLRALGFDVDMLAARVASADGGYTPAFDHMALMVSLDERWLVDVGFGDTFREPLRMDDSGEQAQTERAYRVDRDGDDRILKERKGGEAWKAQYRFDLTAYEYADYAERCRFHQTSPESHFRRGRVCSRATPDGRWTLSGMSFIKTSGNGQREERVLTDEGDVAEVLKVHFGVSLRTSGQNPCA